MSDDVTLPVPSDVDAYNGIVKNAELSDIRLFDLKYSVKPEYFRDLMLEKEGKKKLVRAFEGALSDIKYEKSSKTLGGQFDWMTKVTSSRKKLLQCEAKFFVVYEDVEEVDIAVAEKFLIRVGRFATYPYFRSLVSQLSWESSAELPLMPVLK